MEDKDKLINRANQNRKSDNFYVQFFKMQELAGNFLGKQVKSISRPTVTFQNEDIKTRRTNITSHGRVSYSTVDCIFQDDEEGLTSMFLYAQVFAQANAGLDRIGEINGDDMDRHYRFDVMVSLYNSRDAMTEGYVLRDCIIESITHSEAMMEDGQPNTITVTLNYNDVDFLIMDRYTELLKSGELK